MDFLTNEIIVVVITALFTATGWLGRKSVKRILKIAYEILELLHAVVEALRDGNVDKDEIGKIRKEINDVKSAFSKNG